MPRLPLRLRVGLVFHPEADESLLATWLAEPTMRHQARVALGDRACTTLTADAHRHSVALIARSAPGLGHFAQQVSAHVFEDGAV